NLVPLTVALVAMLVVTAVALWLAMRRGSYFIAILGLIGGFAAPSLLGFSEQPAELFAYLFILNAAISWLAFRMRWPLLIALSVLRITIYEWTWVLQSLTDSQLWLAALIFAAFAIVAAAPFCYRSWYDYPPRFRYVAAVAVLLPLLFAFFMAANTNYGAHVNVLFGFLFVIAVSLFAIVWRGGPVWLHIAGGIATLLTFGIWFWHWWSQLNAPGSWPAGPVPGLVLTIAIWTALFIALYLIRTTIFATLLFAVFIGMAYRQPEDGATLIVAMTGLLLAVLATFIRRRDAILGAIAIAIVAKAVMVLNPLSLLYATQVSHTLNPPPMPWLVLIAFAILFAALFVLAAKLGRPLFNVIAVAFYAWMLITVYAPTVTTLLAFAILPYALFAVYAFFARSFLADVALVVASVVFFLSTTTALHTFAGAVPLIEAAVLFALLWREGREEPRFTLLAISALAFFNAALPLLLPKPFIVIVLALESLALLWLFTRNAYRGFLVWSIGLAIGLSIWITLDPTIYTYVDTYKFFGYILGFAVAICGGIMLLAAYLTPRDMPRLALLFSLLGLTESWYLITIIISNIFHSAGVAFNVGFMNFSPLEDVTYTIAWIISATSLLFIGLHWDWQGARVGATGLLLLSIAKCFLHDVIRRGDPYRDYSLVAVAISLLIAGILLQRYRVHRTAAISY
ncbi:MAG TPA: DUF2339 domain-containing protein, partial [Thermoanaerobaculia bacterium]|nr:DUF2339 domain-containing protein [Thermoanaerobaculia bacterium]